MICDDDDDILSFILINHSHNHYNSHHESIHTILNIDGMFDPT